MKKIYILFVLSVGLMASPMPEQQALDLFASIKKGEYDWVLAQWRNEMGIKTQSRSSLRKSAWESSQQGNIPVDQRTNEPIKTLVNTNPSVVPIPPVDPVTVPDI